MRTDTPHFRLTTALTTAALLLASTAGPGSVRAQPIPDLNQPDQTQPDPPSRVGRLARATGAVSYHAQGDTQWTPATMNFPVATGSSFWTEPGAEAELQFSASRVALAGGSEIDIGALDSNGLQATLTRGKAVLRPRDLTEGEIWTLQTPRGTVTTAHPGRIVVVAGDTDSPTIVSVLEGEARLTGPGLDQPLSRGESANIVGTDTFQVTLGPMAADPFANGMLARERPPLPPPARLQPAPPPPMVAAIPGGNDLAGYGAWSAAPDYGAVWYPSVEPGWVPYRQGHWAFIAPWGWTWVDDAPWGFAPFHYGRWVHLHDRWAWAPGFEHERRFGYPVYAPALVAFVGIGVGVAIGAAFASGSIGWIPLGPREPYRPWYHASPRYLGAMNGGRVTNVTNITNVNGFRNRAAATMVPASAMAASRPIRTLAQPIAPQALGAARPLPGGPHPVQPTLATAGVTPSVARQMNLAPAAGTPPRPAAPGPAILPRSAAPVAAGVGAALPALRAPTPGVPSAPQAPFARPQGIGPGTQPQARPGFGNAPGPALPGAGGATVGTPGPQFRVPNAPGPNGAAPNSPVPSVPRPAAPFSAPTAQAPSGTQHPPSQFTAPPQQPLQRPVPQFHPAPLAPQAPPPVVQRPTPQFTAPPPQAAAPAQRFQPPPQASAPVQHFQPPQAALQVQRFQPPPQAPAPVQRFQPPPQAAPQVQRFQPPPQAQAPPPQFRPAPAAPPPQQQQQRQKRPGES